MIDCTRLEELVARLTMPGPKASHLSASECHEIAEYVAEIIKALRLSDGDRAAMAWAAGFIRCECISETEDGTARTLAVLDRLSGAA